ncbi:Clavaminate synthase-like protein [Trematosphaeria pertusa]|uniref:Clavaminate synthase-like protein n=1 Tax=Trematosphaeria pertusa TaxID=390896 RepID=A0A6A6IDY1_9PLEO|nr:Clavaminate synthase-like protein [Trematosphaeria pertusa]KAF2248417.1 Clavaminate synthase-like protein [Trematosphaeria pertusa]
MAERTGLPVLDLSMAQDPEQKATLLEQLHDALFNVGFLYIKNHGVPSQTISNLAALLPALFNQPAEAKASLTKLNSPHFLGYSGYAEETTLGEKDLREQFDLATELPVVYDPLASQTDTRRNFSKPYWHLRGPNQWPSEGYVRGFRKAFTEYHDALQELSYSFVHLVEEAFGIPVSTFDAFFPRPTSAHEGVHDEHVALRPQHRIKLVRYPPNPCNDTQQGVGAHKDSSGWLTFLYQVGKEEGLEVLDASGNWIAAPPVDDTFVVNFGNAFEAATEGAVKATVHRVKAPGPMSNPRYSIPFFQGLPLDLTVSEIRSYIPGTVRNLRQDRQQTTSNGDVSAFLDPRWDSLGESQLRKWIRSHEDVGRKFYGDITVAYYLQ